MSKKWIWILVTLGVVIIGLVVLMKTGVLGKDEGTRVSAEKAQKRDITEVVTASGKVYPEVEVKISPDVSGEIVELNVVEGDSVMKGQVLARIYADIYATQRDQASAVVTQQQAQVQNVSANADAVKARMEQAERQYKRQKQLFEDKVISRLEFEQAENAYMTAKADYNAVQQSIKSTQAGVQSARANLTSSEKNLSRTTVTAPMNGVVSLLNVKKGERVVGNSMMAGTEMMRVADLRVIEVRVDVGENDVPKVHYGDTAVIEVDAYTNRKFKGIVTQIASSNRSTTGTVAVSSTDVTNYEVRIRLDPASYMDLIDPTRPKSFPFRPGMSASADIQTRTHKSVLAVPINAVTTRDKNDTAKAKGGAAPKAAKSESSPQGGDMAQDNNKPATNSDDLQEVVFVLQADGTIKRVKVRTDIQDINYIEVVDGVKEGDQVITGPYSTVSKVLREGMKVKVVPKEQLFETKK
jgi:HlyD family secretion protein